MILTNEVFRMQVSVSTREIQRALWGGKHGSGQGPEAPVLKVVLDYLNLLPDCIAWRQNTGGRSWVDARGKKRVVRYGKVGQGDITGLLRGYRLEVETKAEGEEPGDKQYEWMSMIRRFGGIAFWCDSLEMCQLKLGIEFQRRGWK